MSDTTTPRAPPNTSPRKRSVTPPLISSTSFLSLFAIMAQNMAQSKYDAEMLTIFTMKGLVIYSCITSVTGINIRYANRKESIKNMKPIMSFTAPEYNPEASDKHVITTYVMSRKFDVMIIPMI